MYSAGKEKVLGSQAGTANPGSNGIACHLLDLELYGSMALLLHDNCSRRDTPAVCHVAYPKLDEIARSQLTVDGEIE
jgi:hypothetical protein